MVGSRQKDGKVTSPNAQIIFAGMPVAVAPTVAVATSHLATEEDL